MPVIVGDRPPPLLVAAGLVLVGLLFGVVIGVAWGSRPAADLAAVPAATTAASSTTQPPRPTVAQAASSAPSQLIAPASQPPAPSAGQLDPSGPPEASAVAAIWESVDRLNDLRAYRFQLGLAGRSPINPGEPNGAGMAVRGSLIQKPELALDVEYQLQTVEFGGDAGISSGQRIVLVGDTAWTPRPGQSLEPQVVKKDSDLDSLKLLLPDGMITRLIVPFAAGFERVGPERRNGADATRYRLTDQGARVYATTTNCAEAWTGNLWIGDAGHLMSIDLRCTGRAEPTDAFRLQVEVTDPDDPSIEIEPPS